ncbi:MAG: hypothetical protein JST65_11000 [Acidobacteria bacterium]|nr:hypothetical protein [Acidobacteriota bacterium]
MTDFEALIERRMTDLQRHVRSLWAGREREAVIEIVRAADEAACVTQLGQPRQSGQRHYFVLKGVTSALATFLPDMEGQGRGLQFGPSNPELAAVTDGMLVEFGKIATLRRLASLEHYRLARSRNIDAHTVEMVVRSDTAEEQDRSASKWLASETKRKLRASQGAWPDQKRITKLLGRTSAVDRGWFIRYEGHKKLIRHYRDAAMESIVGCLESEALPDAAMIGGRTFGEWRRSCAASLGSLFNHIAYASHLQHKNPHLMLRSLLSTPVLRHDAIAVLLERGEHLSSVDVTLARFTLNTATIDAWLTHHEIPAPYYVDLGGGWLLLCAFGALLNPIHGMVRSLRMEYRREWDSAVSGREEEYRGDLNQLFSAPRFTVLRKGVVLKRADGSHLTDIDAVIMDHKTGAVALAQLKWPDPVGMSPQERESRRRNLLEANDWVERVSTWISTRGLADIRRALGISITQSFKPPVLMVIPRYAARFTGTEKYDDRAAWLTWAEVVRVMATNPMDPLSEIGTKFKGGGAIPAPEKIADYVYELKDLKVIVRVE